MRKRFDSPPFEVTRQIHTIANHMRIGLDVHVLSGRHQGTVTVWMTLLQHLPPTHTFVLYSFDPDATRAAFPGSHFEHRRIPVHQALVRIPFVYPWLARRDRCDAFHVNFFGPPIGARGLVCTIHDTLYLDLPKLAPLKQRLMHKYLGWLTARRAHRVVVSSAYTRERVAQHYGLLADRAAIVHLGLSDDWFAPDEARIAAAWERLRDTLPKRYMLSVGRWEPRKNHVLAADVSRRLIDRNLVDGLVVVGAEDFGSRAMTAELVTKQLTSVVTSLQNLDIHALQAVYRHATALFFLSEGEGFGYPAVEGMTMDTLVIGAARGSIPEICGDAALIVGHLDPQHIADRTAELLGDDGRCAQLRARGRVRALEFTGDVFAKRMLAIYESVA